MRCSKPSEKSTAHQAFQCSSNKLFPISDPSPLPKEGGEIQPSLRHYSGLQVALASVLRFHQLFALQALLPVGEDREQKGSLRFPRLGLGFSAAPKLYSVLRKMHYPKPRLANRLSYLNLLHP